MKTKYKNIPHSVDAYQWTGGETYLCDLPGFITLFPGFYSIEIKGSPNRLEAKNLLVLGLRYITGEVQQLMIQEGSWVVLNKLGEIEVWPDEKFHLFYK